MSQALSWYRPSPRLAASHPESLRCPCPPRARPDRAAPESSARTQIPPDAFQSRCAAGCARATNGRTRLCPRCSPENRAATTSLGSATRSRVPNQDSQSNRSAAFESRYLAECPAALLRNKTCGAVLRSTHRTSVRQQAVQPAIKRMAGRLRKRLRGDPEFRLRGLLFAEPFILLEKTNRVGYIIVVATRLIRTGFFNGLLSLLIPHHQHPLVRKHKLKQRILRQPRGDVLRRDSQRRGFAAEKARVITLVDEQRPRRALHFLLPQQLAHKLHALFAPRAFRIRFDHCVIEIIRQTLRRHTQRDKHRAVRQLAPNLFRHGFHRTRIQAFDRRSGGQQYDRQRRAAQQRRRNARKPAQREQPRAWKQKRRAKCRRPEQALVRQQSAA